LGLPRETQIPHTVERIWHKRRWRLSKDVKGMRRLMSEFHRQNPKAPQHISAIDFSRLPFGPLTNFMDTLDTGPSDWATG